VGLHSEPNESGYPDVRHQHAEGELWYQLGVRQLKESEMLTAKASLFGLIGFVAFTLGWGWYYFRPTPNKAIGANLIRAMVTTNPLYWALALTVAFGCASTYLYLGWWRH
jgi:hypothetical protein